jgi:hypothetical protein
VVPATYPLADDTIVDCIISSVGPPAVLDESAHTVVPCRVHRGRKLTIEIWPEIQVDDLIVVASNVMGTVCCLHDITRYPIQSGDETLIAIEQEVYMEQRKLDVLRKEDEIRSRQNPHARLFLRIPEE